jgi:hypothetical protein
MDAMSDETPDVDSAGVYFVSVEEFEHREPERRRTQATVGRAADKRPLESTTGDDPLPKDPAATLRKCRGHSTGASSS